MEVLESAAIMDLALRERTAIVAAANEYTAYGITVNNVCPGYTHTARVDYLAGSISARSGVQPEEVFAQWAREIPAGRIGTPEEFAAVVAFPSAPAMSMARRLPSTAAWFGACSRAMTGTHHLELTVLPRRYAIF